MLGIVETFLFREHKLYYLNQYSKLLSDSVSSMSTILFREHKLYSTISTSTVLYTTVSFFLLYVDGPIYRA